MHTLEEVIQLFNNYFNNSKPFPSEPHNLYEPCTYILESGGKRIRPALSLMAAQMFCNRIPEDAFHVALAIELFHNFTLIHDDIMDEAPLRRGRTTVHTKYGISSAILSGDVMNIFSYKALCQIEVKYLPGILNLVNTTAIEVCEGQQLDMDFENIEAVSTDDYIEMITLKTSVLLAGALKAGAIIGDASDKDADNLYQFGKNLGIAFQLQDDLLDVFGNNFLTGKQEGGDILAHKKTFLWINLISHLSEEDKIVFDAALHYNNDEKVNAIKMLYNKYEIQAATQKLINEYYDIAINYLDAIDLPVTNVQPIRDLAKNILLRNY